jgi:hypothetical protein
VSLQDELLVPHVPVRPPARLHDGAAVHYPRLCHALPDARGARDARRAAGGVHDLPIPPLLRAVRRAVGEASLPPRHRAALRRARRRPPLL